MLLTRSTALEDVTRLAVVALAADAERLVVGGLAVSIWSALGRVADIHALGLAVLCAADSRGRAVAVDLALHGRLAAELVRVTDRAQWAQALERAGLVLAGGSTGAGAGPAEVDRFATGQRIANESLAAETDGAVVFRKTERVLTAGVVHLAGNCGQTSGQ